jgi:hypothetical protein
MRVTARRSTPPRSRLEELIPRREVRAGLNQPLGGQYCFPVALRDAAYMQGELPTASIG